MYLILKTNESVERACDRGSGGISRPDQQLISMV